MKNKNILLVIIILGVLLFMGYGSLHKDSDNIVSNDTTTDTSIVATTTTSTSIKKPVPVYTGGSIKIGQKVLINGVSITPGKVTYDSRCPKDVQCIQAGTVELGVLLESGKVSQNVIITLGKPFLFEGTMVTLTSVIPSKVSTKTIKESDYRFSFTVKI